MYIKCKGMDFWINLVPNAVGSLVWNREFASPSALLKKKKENDRSLQEFQSLKENKLRCVYLLSVYITF